MLILRLNTAQPAKIKLLYRCKFGGFILHSIAVVTESAERYDQLKIKTKERKKTIVISHNSVA